MSALEGITVVDLTRYVAGPMAAMLLADLGADVIKVEALPTGDASRQSGPFIDGESTYFMVSNRNKRSLAVNLRTPEGKEVLERLLSGADVFIENLRPQSAAAMGLSPADVRAINPRLVHVSISGFGTGPIGATLPGFDQTVQAMSGLMSVTGTAETGPLRVGTPVADTSTGAIAAVGALAGLMQRERTGIGSLVETSLMGSMLTMLTYQAQAYLSTGQVPVAHGNDHPILFPQGTFRTRDHPIAIASGNERMWRVLCGVLGLEELAEDERFSTNAGRMAHRVELRAILEERLAGAGAQEWVDRINAAGIPCGPVLDVGSALEHEITRELGMVVEAEHATLGTTRILGPAISVDGADPTWLRHGPPTLGQHSAEVAGELGYESEEIARLVEAGVLAGPLADG